jgi:hypothetical protein
MRYCNRCSQLIRPGEEHDTYMPETGSGVAPAVHTHKQPCPIPAPTDSPELPLPAARRPRR